MNLFIESIYLCIYLCIYVSMHLTSLSTAIGRGYKDSLVRYLSIYLCIYLSNLYLSIYLSIYRTSEFMTHPVFNTYHSGTIYLHHYLCTSLSIYITIHLHHYPSNISIYHHYVPESQMMRYLKYLENKDLSLNFSMIALGSCTMKLNAAVEMVCIYASMYL
jgi:hypothetical protein